MLEQIKMQATWISSDKVDFIPERGKYKAIFDFYRIGKIISLSSQWDNYVSLCVGCDDEFESSCNEGNMFQVAIGYIIGQLEALRH